jgi:hypothetical protein
MDGLSLMCTPPKSLTGARGACARVVAGEGGASEQDESDYANRERCPRDPLQCARESA